MSLTLFAPATAASPVAPVAGRPPPPVQVGDRVHVPTAVDLSDGSRIRAAHYTVLAVDWQASAPAGAVGRAAEAAPCWRLTIEARLQNTSSRAPEHAAQKRPVYLFPGEWTAYDAERTDGRHPADVTARSRALDQ